MLGGAHAVIAAELCSLSRCSSGQAVDRATDQRWMLRAACREHPPSLFFPSDGVGVEAAARVCVGCPVRLECLEYALLNRLRHGVWGGCSERERGRILRKRRDSVTT